MREGETMNLVVDAMFLEKRPRNKEVSYVSKTNPEETRFYSVLGKFQAK